MATRTWNSLASTAWGATPGGANANWLLMFTPTLADAAVFDATSSIDCVAPGGAECLSLTCTAYTGDLSGEVLAYGNVVLASGMTAAGLDIGFKANGSLDTVGQTIAYFFSDDAVAMSLASDVTVTSECYFDSGGGASLDFGTRIMTFLVSGDIYATGIAITYSAGSELRYQIPDGNGQGLFVEADMANEVWPPITISKKVGDTGTGAFTFALPTKCESFTLNSAVYNAQGSGYLFTTGAVALLGGSVSNLGGATLTVGGNFSSDIDLVGGSTWFLNVTGTNVAPGRTITNCDASGGTALTVVNGTDGTGNTNVVFVYQTTWDTDSGTFEQDTASNYSDGLPDATTSVIVIGAGSQIRTAIYNDYDCLNFDMSAFTGSQGKLTFGDYLYISGLYGNFTYGAGMTTEVGAEVHAQADGNLTTAGQWFYTFDINIGTTTLVDDCTALGFSVQTAGTLAIGANTLNISTPTPGIGAGNFSADTGASFSWTSGSLRFVTAAGEGTSSLNNNSSNKLPPIVLTGDGDFQLGTDAYCASFNASTYTGSFDHGTYNLIIDGGNCDVTGIVTSANTTFEIHFLNDATFLVGTGTPRTLQVGPDTTVTATGLLSYSRLTLENGSVLACGAGGLTIGVEGALNTVAIALDTTAQITGSGTFTIHVQANATHTIQGTTAVLPPVLLECGAGAPPGVYQLDGSNSVGTFYATSITATSGGALDLNGVNVQTTIDFDIDIPISNLGGRTVTVGGDFTADTDLIGASNWTLDVTGTGTVVAGNTITNCQATNPVDASGCIDGGGNNANVQFTSGPSPVLQASGGAVGSTGFGF